MAIRCPLHHPSLGWYILVPGPNGKDQVELIISPSHYYQSMGVNPTTSNPDSSNEEIYEDFLVDYDFDLPSQSLSSMGLSSLLGQAILPQSVPMSQSPALSSYLFLPPVTMHVPGTSSNLNDNYSPVASAVIEKIPYNSFMSSGVNPTNLPVIESYSMSPSLMSSLLSDFSYAHDSVKSMFTDFEFLPMKSTKPYKKNSMSSMISGIEALPSASTVLSDNSSISAKISDINSLLPQKSSMSYESINNSTSSMLSKVATSPFKLPDENFMQSNIAANKPGPSTHTKSSNYKPLMLPTTSSVSSASKKSAISNLLQSTMDFKPIPSTSFKFPTTSSKSKSSITNK